MIPKPTGVLLMAYGSPTSLAEEEVSRYLAHIRGGREPARHEVAALIARYRAIGGSPFLAQTRAQARALSARLARDFGPARFAVRLGMRHARPSISEALSSLWALGAREVVALPLAPHASVASTGAYLAAARQAAGELGGVRLAMVEGFARSPGLARFWSRMLRRALARLEREGVPRDRVGVIFSAHSIPERLVLSGDPYRDEVESTARAIASLLGLEGFSVCFQSAPEGVGGWLGPGPAEVLEELASRGLRAALFCPVGFLCEHLEVLYDLDVEAREEARRLGLTYARAPLPATDPGLITTLEELVVGAVLKGGSFLSGGPGPEAAPPNPAANEA